jgi:hypothetical protein
MVVNIVGLLVLKETLAGTGQSFWIPTADCNNLTIDSDLILTN